MYVFARAVTILLLNMQTTTLKCSTLHELKPATHTTETGTSRLVPVVWYQKLARVSVNLVPDFSGTRFWYAIEHSSIPSQKLSGT